MYSAGHTNLGPCTSLNIPYTGIFCKRNLDTVVCLFYLLKARCIYWPQIKLWRALKSSSVQEEIFNKKSVINFQATPKQQIFLNEESPVQVSFAVISLCRVFCILLFAVYVV